MKIVPTYTKGPRAVPKCAIFLFFMHARPVYQLLLQQFLDNILEWSEMPSAVNITIKITVQYLDRQYLLKISYCLVVCRDWIWRVWTNLSSYGLKQNVL
jgi:hypothetical protein